MKKIKTSKLIQQQKIANSITVSPLSSGGFNVFYHLKEKKEKGTARIRNIYVDAVVEDTEIPQISNDTVKHLGYNTYKHYIDGTFYINYYKFN